MHMYVHSMAIHNNQKTEAIQMPTNGGKEKPMVYPGNGALFSHKKW